MGPTGSPVAVTAATPDRPHEECKTQEDFDEWLKVPGNEEKIPAFVRPHFRTLLKSPDGFASALLDMMSKASLALVPIHALILRLLYWRSRRFYGEHIVFSLHLHSFAYVLYALSTLLGLAASADVGSTADTLAGLGGGVYAVAAARPAYAEGVVRSALKMTLAGFGYVIALG